MYVGVSDFTAHCDIIKLLGVSPVVHDQPSKKRPLISAVYSRPNLAVDTVEDCYN